MAKSLVIRCYKMGIEAAYLYPWIEALILCDLLVCDMYATVELRAFYGQVDRVAMQFVQFSYLVTVSSIILNNMQLSL